MISISARSGETEKQNKKSRRAVNPRGINRSITHQTSDIRHLIIRVIREFVMSKVSSDSMMNADMVVELLRPQLEVTKEYNK